MHQATGSHNRMCSLLACVAVAGNRSLHGDPSAPGPVGPHYCQCLISWRSSDFQEDQGAEHILGREVPCLWSLWDARAVLVGWSSAPRLLLSPELPTVRAQASLRYCPVTSIFQTHKHRLRQWAPGALTVPCTALGTRLAVPAPVLTQPTTTRLPRAARFSSLRSRIPPR